MKSKLNFMGQFYFYFKSIKQNVIENLKAAAVLSTSYIKKSDVASRWPLVQICFI